MYQQELWVALKAARAGGAVVRENFGAVMHAEYKGDANPVTKVDRASEDHILAVLRHHYPHDRFMAEESGGAGDLEGRVWLVDPLDGTVNYLHAVPQVAVSVALWVDGEAALGVVIDPIRGEEFTAQRGGGAFHGSNPIRVSPQTELAQSLIATGFPYDRNLHAEAYAANLAGVLARVQGIRRLGSAALDLAWVAWGRYEGYWEYALHPWDTAAGVVLVTEAGGQITNPRGGDYHLDDSGIVASNRLIHQGLVEAVQLAPPSHLP
ncbi:MAG TPA: inositol monophosphatase family protein [Acidimicrobiia bacterium]|nr:inositol monophosphatase family protein [Acidimicrobiia bacterium]